METTINPHILKMFNAINFPHRVPNGLLFAGLVDGDADQVRFGNSCDVGLNFQSL